MCALVVGVAVVSGCSDSDHRAGRATSTSTSTSAASPTSTSFPSSTTPPTATIPPASLGSSGPLELSGSSDGSATIELEVDAAAVPITTQTDRNNEFRFTVPDVRDGAHTILVGARARDGALVGLALQASLKEGGSTTTSSVTCSGVVQLEVKIGDGESLTVRCPPG